MDATQATKRLSKISITKLPTANDFECQFSIRNDLEMTIDHYRTNRNGEGLWKLTTPCAYHDGTNTRETLPSGYTSLRDGEWKQLICSSQANFGLKRNRAAVRALIVRVFGNEVL